MCWWWWWWWWRCDGINADYPYFPSGCFSGPPTHNNMNNKSCSERVVFVSAMMMFGSVFSFEQYLVCYLSSLIFVAVVFVVLLHSLVRRICPIDGAPHLPPHPPPSPLTSPATAAAASPADFSLPPPPFAPQQIYQAHLISITQPSTSKHRCDSLSLTFSHLLLLLLGTLGRFSPLRDQSAAATDNNACPD